MDEDTHVIRDPYYGSIKFSEAERKVLDTEPVQRLRRIRQLGFSDHTYPCGTHTRFEHSLGVMHLAGMFADRLGLDEEYVADARMAGLLHDVGHGPFSHASETILEEEGRSHEDLSCRIVDDLSDILPASPDNVKALIRGEADVNIISGAIDADRMDYLRRDSGETGVEQGMIDYQTIIEYSDVENGELVFDEKCIQALEGLLTARFHMITSVYYYHTSTIAETMLQRALEDYMTQSDLSVDELMKFDDYEMHNELLAAEGDAHHFYERLTTRELYKRSLILDETALPRSSLAHLEDMADAHDLEREIAEEAGLPTRTVLVNTPTTPSDSPFEARIRRGGEVNPLSEVSPIPSALKDAEWRTTSLDVYAPEQHVDTVREAAKPVVNALVS